MNYQFDFSKLTIQDNTHLSVLMHYGPVWFIVDKVTDGGALHRPANEGAELWRQFLEAYTAYMATPPQPEIDGDVWRLEDIEGL